MRPISLILFTSLCIPIWGQLAAADDNAPSGDPPIRQPSGQHIDDISSQEYIAPALSEDVIIVYGALPDKPFQRDTQLRITGAELRKRGISNLAEALDILPEINVRPAGRGGRQIDIRGARKGSVKVLLDGIAISDPFYGNIDISAIPVTDIEEIRISSSPASPIDGPGGPGGVVEIFTSDAVGPDMLRLRVRAASHPSAEVSVTGRTSLTPSWGLRMSISSMLGAEEFELRLPDENSSEPSSFFLSEDRDQSVANARIEYKKGERRLATDIWLQQVAFVVPPARDGSSRYLAIEGESQGRLGLAYDDRWKQFRVQLHAHYHLLSRQSTYYEDPQLKVGAQSEDLNAARAGLSFVANRKLGRDLQVIAQATLESENAEVDGFDGVNTIGRASIAQSALGLAYRGGTADLSAAAGIAVPLGIGAAPWAEVKLLSRLRPVTAVEFQLTLGHKGRTPTLRERLRIDIGNESLGPEKAYFGEMKMTFQPTQRWKITWANYLRRTNGLIRFDPVTRSLGNTKDLWTRGIEAGVETKIGERVSVGGNYNYAEAHSRILGSDPLDFFPKHRGSAWLRLSYQRFGATTRVQYWGTQIDRDTELPARSLIQATLYARITEQYLLSMRGENLSGRVYEQRLGIRAPGRVFFTSVQAQW